MFESCCELPLVGVSIAVVVQSLAMLLVVAPLASVVTSVQELVSPLPIETTFLPTPFVVLGLHPPLGELVVEPLPLSQNFIVETQSAFTFSLVGPPLSRVSFSIGVEVVTTPFLHVEFPLSLIQISVEVV